MARSTPKRGDRQPLDGALFPSQVLASNVRKRRLLADLTQEQLGARMSHLQHEWSAGIVGFVERGDRAVTVDELVGLALCLECTVPDLLDPAGPDRRGRQGVDVGVSRPFAPAWARQWLRGNSSQGSNWSEDDEVMGGEFTFAVVGDDAVIDDTIQTLMIHTTEEQS